MSVDSPAPFLADLPGCGLPTCFRPFTSNLIWTSLTAFAPSVDGVAVPVLSLTS
jgi:hypothetical protein